MRRISRTANNEIRKSVSTWLRTLSLGFLAVAFLEPLRGANTPSALQFAAAYSIGILAFALSLVTLAFMEDEK